MDFKVDWSKKSNELSWYFNKEIRKHYTNPPASVKRLSDKTGVAVVISSMEFGKKNAVIYNNDGSERFWLNFPSSLSHIICFSDIYYVNGILTVIIATTMCDFACEIDEQTGSYTRIYETR